MTDPPSDMPAITLLPVQVVKDLRVIADYLVKSPGINHTGMILHARCCVIMATVSADIMSLYAQIRCSQLGRAMNTLLQTSQNQSLLPPTVSSHAHSPIFHLLMNTVHDQVPKKSAFTATCESWLIMFVVCECAGLMLSFEGQPHAHS